MGAGKTTVGRRLAACLGVDFFDLDALIESRRGHTVAEIFAREGESAFRALESAVFAELLAAAPAVVAVGGGAMLADENRAAARRVGCLVTLAVSPAVATARVQRDGPTRPLFDTDGGALASRFADRAAAYADADVVVDTDGRDVDAVLSDVRVALAARGVL